MTKQSYKGTLLSPQDRQLLEYLRENPPTRSRKLKERPPTFGERAADFVASTVGSWRFIIIQSVLLIIWIILNVTAWKNHWDPYPFILLNLMLSFQAAYTGPIVMMSQNRAGDIDRKRAQQDLDCDLQAFLEIQLVHEILNKFEAQELIDFKARLEWIEGLFLNVKNNSRSL